ncbi:MAG: HNH endonuclease [Deltaproteobacteria bacterium]|nr:HNH endonuclease [Deltaproteobacteria bacterium]
MSKRHSKEANQRRRKRNNAQTKEQLGTSKRVATTRLTRRLMWDYAIRLGLDVCYRCGKKIETFEEMTIEHKRPWLHQSDAKKRYYDLDNIAHSHHSCNAQAGSRRFTDEEFQDMIQMYKSGHTQGQVGEKYHIPASYVSYILSGKHLTANKFL